MLTNPEQPFTKTEGSYPYPVEQNIGIEPIYSDWKSDILTIVLILHMEPFGKRLRTCLGSTQTKTGCLECVGHSRSDWLTLGDYHRRIHPYLKPKRFFQEV